MNKGKVTIKDIAKELGISPSTVSKALSGNKEISPVTRKAVNDFAKKWNYHTDQIALSLKSGQSKTIGVIVPEIVHFFFSTVISGIEDVAYNSGYHVMFCQSNESYEREVKSVDTLLASRVDGILVSMSKTSNEFDHFSKIVDAGVPLVFFDRVCEEIDTDRVIVDDEKGAYEAVKHLYERGCRRIIHLSGPQNLSIGRGRKEGYKRAIRECGLKFSESNVVRCDTPEDARKIVPGLIERNPRPDGIFAVNEMTAAETMSIIKQSGLKIPDDIALVGFTNGAISDLTDPRLSSVEQYGYEVGSEAVRLLIERVESKNKLPTRTKIINTKLIIKGSSDKRYI